jgi:hypothetical protein
VMGELPEDLEGQVDTDAESTSPAALCSRKKAAIPSGSQHRVVSNGAGFEAQLCPASL